LCWAPQVLRSPVDLRTLPFINSFPLRKDTISCDGLVLLGLHDPAECDACLLPLSVEMDLVKRGVPDPDRALPEVFTMASLSIPSHILRSSRPLYPLPRLSHRLLPPFAILFREPPAHLKQICSYSFMPLSPNRFSIVPPHGFFNVFLAPPP